MGAPANHDAAAAAELWHPGGVDRLIGLADLVGPPAVPEYFEQFFAAFPDLTLEVVDEIADDRRYWF